MLNAGRSFLSRALDFTVTFFSPLLLICAGEYDYEKCTDARTPSRA